MPIAVLVRILLLKNQKKSPLDRRPALCNLKMALSSVEFWESFYDQHVDLREWYLPQEDVLPVILPRIKDGDIILHIGCGSSETSVDILRERPCCRIVNIDFSESVVQNMIHRFGDDDRQEFHSIDVRDMSRFPNSTFDIILVRCFF